MVTVRGPPTVPPLYEGHPGGRTDGAFGAGKTDFSSRSAFMRAGIEHAAAGKAAWMRRSGESPQVCIA